MLFIYSKFSESFPVWPDDGENGLYKLLRLYRLQLEKAGLSPEQEESFHQQKIVIAKKFICYLKCRKTE